MEKQRYRRFFPSYSADFIAGLATLFVGNHRSDFDFFSFAIDSKALVVPIAMHNSDAIVEQEDLLIYPGQIKI